MAQLIATWLFRLFSRGGEMWIRVAVCYSPLKICFQKVRCGISFFQGIMTPFLACFSRLNPVLYFVAYSIPSLSVHRSIDLVVLLFNQFGLEKCIKRATVKQNGRGGGEFDQILAD